MRLAGVGLFLILVCRGFTQQPVEKPRFEVASIKPSDPNPSNPMWIGMTSDHAMVTYTNITLKDCIRAAYRVRDFQITGPGWIETARYEIKAKLPAGASTEQIPEMLQTLLADRFMLTLRRDSREEPVYALTVGKGGAKLKPSQAKSDDRSPMALGPDGRPRPAIMFRFSSSGVSLTAPSASLSSFVELMSRFTSRPVIDMTGLEGQYELELTFAPEAIRGVNTGGLLNPDGTPTSSDPAPSVFEAVGKYGLHLEARKAPLEMLTITHAEKNPVEN
jgi:uncharacterized protein (TIGR03435 family)